MGVKEPEKKTWGDYVLVSSTFSRMNMNPNFFLEEMQTHVH